MAIKFEVWKKKCGEISDEDKQQLIYLEAAIDSALLTAARSESPIISLQNLTIDCETNVPERVLSKMKKKYQDAGWKLDYIDWRNNDNSNARSVSITPLNESLEE